MKTRYYLTLLCLVLGIFGAYAKVIRVNNLEPSNPQQNTYADLQSAYNNAQTGDTLYLEGSHISYGSLTLTKRLVLIGSGYFLENNEGLSANRQVAFVLRINFNAGSSGSKVIGLSFSATTSSSVGLSVGVNDIEVAHCYFPYSSPITIAAANITNLVIHGCYFGDPRDKFWYSSSAYQSPKNLLFSNNIVIGTFNIVRDNATGSIVNNLFLGDVFNVGTNATLQIHNNILTGINESSVTLPGGSGSNISHNIAAKEQFGTSNNNQSNVPESDIFIGGESPDAKYLIRPGGPADKKGRNGVDIGPFGGTRPYRLSGLVDLPVIYDFAMSGFATPEGKLPVTIKIRAN